MMMKTAGKKTQQNYNSQKAYEINHYWICIYITQLVDNTSIFLHDTALTWQCTTQTFLDDCRSHAAMFLQIENSRSNAGALLGFQPHSDTCNSIRWFTARHNIYKLLYKHCINYISYRFTSRLFFYSPIAPPVPNAPELRSLHAAAPTVQFRISRRALCCCSSANAGTAIGANFKIYLLHQFCSNRVQFFTLHRRHRCKKWWTRILKFILWFERIFVNFQKGIARSLCGRSGSLWSRPI